MNASRQKTAHKTLSHNTTTYVNIHVLFYLVGVFSLDYYSTCLLCSGGSGGGSSSLRLQQDKEDTTGSITLTLTGLL
jgi:hypothetical protein